MKIRITLVPLVTWYNNKTPRIDRRPKSLDTLSDRFLNQYNKSLLTYTRHTNFVLVGKTVISSKI